VKSSAFDAAIVGGGPAGLATAIGLPQAGLGAILIEVSDYTGVRVGEHLAPSGKAMLAALGAGELAADAAHAASPGVRSAWGSATPADKDYVFDPHGEGLNLARPHFDRTLAAHAADCGADVRTQTKLANLSYAAGLWRLSLATAAGGTAEVSARLVVDATGRAASVAKRLGAQPVVYDDLIGLFGQGHDRSAISKWVFIEAQADGWWYSAGLADGGSVATFLTDPDLVDVSGAGRAAAWRAQLARSTLTQSRYAGSVPGEVLHVRSARTQRLGHVTGDGWLAVGDAAMSFDPLSSEGITKGLEMGRAAAASIRACCRGETNAFADYQRQADMAFAQYLEAWHRFYAAERRWPDAPFWRRRRGQRRPKVEI
jgi:flavin-dependent dehydrogenase